MSGSLLPEKETLKELQHRIADFDDEVAYRQLFFHFFLPLKSFSYSIIQSKELAEEIVSDLFIDIWEKRKQLMEINDIRLYLYTSTRNNSLRKHRQQHKATFLSLDEVEVEFASKDPDAEVRLLGREMQGRIEAAIAQLPQKCKLIFKLAKEDKLRYKEIAELLNISVKTIDNQVATALKKIATVLNLPNKKPSA